MPSCFVIMGYGKKTDFKQNKNFDLDKTYRNIIKPAAQMAGYTCERADEIQHAGVIDVPMYERLLTADLVIADSLPPTSMHFSSSACGTPSAQKQRSSWPRRISRWGSIWGTW